MDDRITDRKKNILKIVVDEYLNAANPVSSKAIVENHLTDISSATVRSELAALEDMGYLIQFHTSGGRIPSAKAYKLYIDELMQRGVTAEQTQEIRASMERRATSAESIVKSVADVISEFTEYTSVALSDLSEETILNVGLFPCGEKALLLLVTDLRILKDSFITLPEQMTAEELGGFSATLQTIFGGKRMSEVRDAEAAAMQAFAAYREVCREVLDALFSYTQKRDVVLSGENKSLRRADYDDVNKVKDFLSLVESKERMETLLSDDEPNIQIQVKIGKEGNIPEDCSMVTASYSAGGKQIGTYGVLGPVRMDYAKVVSVLESVGEILQTILKK